MAAAAAAKSLQLCPTLWDPIDGSPRGSPFPGILQARTLEWVAISFSNAWKWKVKVRSLSRVQLFSTPWTAAYQAPPSMGFSRQEYWSGVPLPSPDYILGLPKYLKWLKQQKSIVSDSGSKKLETKVSAELVSSEGCLWACRELRNPCVFTPSFLSVCLCPNFLMKTSVMLD